MREFLDRNDLFGSVKMWYDVNKSKRVGIIVEAKTDEKLFGKMLDKGSCVFFHSDGWSKAIPAIVQVNQHQTKGVICIIDADFKRIESKEPDIGNLFMTDYHDAEMMMIASPAWESVINEYADTSTPQKGDLSKLAAFEKKNGRSVKDHLLQSCQPLSCFILLNEREQLYLKFKNFIQRKGNYKYIDYTRFVNKNDLSINIDDLIPAVEDFSVKQGLFKDRSELRTALDTLLKEQHDLLEFCNGHHLINILHFALKKTIGNIKQDVSRERIEESLRIAYRFEDFQQTNLYTNLKGWENQNTPPYQLF